MSTLDTMTGLISAPWLDADGKVLSTRSLPGLRPEMIRTLELAYPDMISPGLRELLLTCSGLADTELGHIDFTGCGFPEEPCTVFHPCLTLAIDDTGRRWIAELDGDLPGPVWCMFPDPAVAVYVSEDLASFLAKLRTAASQGKTLDWLRELNASAHAVWSRRSEMALRPHTANHQDEQIRGWLTSLPMDAYIYDLREPMSIKGWPYGVAGPAGRLYRCGRLPVFAVAGSRTEGWHMEPPQTTAPIYPIAQTGLPLTYAERHRHSSTPPWRMRPLLPTSKESTGKARLCA